MATFSVAAGTVTHLHIHTCARMHAPKIKNTTVQQQVACLCIGHAVSLPGLKRPKRALTSLRMSTVKPLLLLCTSYDILWDDFCLEIACLIKQARAAMTQRKIEYLM